MLSSRRCWYGLELANHLNIGNASVYVVLDRLEESGWLQSAWEEVDPVAKGRPRRRLYKLTPEGASRGREMVAGYRPRVRLDSLPTPHGTAQPA